MHPGQPQSGHGSKGSFCSWLRLQRGLPFCIGPSPNSGVENNAFLLEVSGSPVNHSVVTADPNTALGWGSEEKRSSNQSAGKGNPRSNRLGFLFFSYSCGQWCYISTNTLNFPKPLPRGPLQQQTTLRRSQNQPPKRTQEKILLVTDKRWQRYSVIRAQHQSLACKDLAPNPTASQWATRETSGEESAQCEELEDLKAETACA